jgi:hypothetical protein
MDYITSKEEHPLEIVNLSSLETKVKEGMDKGAFGYIRGGSEEEWTLRENTQAFFKKKLFLVCYKELIMQICQQNYSVFLWQRLLFKPHLPLKDLLM